MVQSYVNKFKFKNSFTLIYQVIFNVLIIFVWCFLFYYFIFDIKITECLKLYPQTEYLTKRLFNKKFVYCYYDIPQSKVDDIMNNICNINYYNSNLNIYKYKAIKDPFNIMSHYRSPLNHPNVYVELLSSIDPNIKINIQMSKRCLSGFTYFNNNSINGVENQYISNHFYLYETKAVIPYIYMIMVIQNCI